MKWPVLKDELTTTECVSIFDKLRRCNHSRVSIAVLALAFLGPVSPTTVSATTDLPPDLTELSLDELSSIRVDTVYGASKYVQKIKEAPSIVTIVDSDEIKKYGDRTLADILRSVSGFYTSYDRNYSYLGVRGFNRPGDYNGRVLLLVDGHRLNEDLYGSAMIGSEFPLDIDLIERVEIVRGPSFSVFGNNAVFAVINVVTRRGSDLSGGEVSGAVGSYDSYNARFSFGKRLQNDLEFLVSGSFYDSAGVDQLYYPEFNTPTNRVNHGIAEDADYDRAYNFLASLSYHDFTFEGLYGSREKGIPTGSYGTTFNDPEAKTTDTRGYLDAKWQHQFEADYEATARLHYDYYHYEGDYPYEPAINKDIGYGNSWGAEVQLTKRLFDRHTFVAGLTFQDNFQQDQKNYDIHPYQLYLDDQRDSINWGAFAQADIGVLTNLVLSAGVRYDYFSTFGDTVNPRVGLIYNPFAATTLKFLYGSAFRAPNAYELYYAGVGGKANPDLNPENTTTYQFDFEQDLTKQLHLFLTPYFYQVKDLITQERDESDGLLVYRNLERVSGVGGEVGLDATFPSGWRGRLSYGLQQAKNDDTGEELSSSPLNMVKANLIIPLYRDKLFSGLELQYYSNVKSITGNTLEGYWFANLTLFSQKLVKGLEISASIYNLFNEHYYNPGSSEHLQDAIEQDGRTFRLKLVYRF
jgi:outer membrane receptor for ferrienterochelin and colicins